MKLPTRVLPVDPSKAGRFIFDSPSGSLLDKWDFSLHEGSQDAAHLQDAARHLLQSDTPVAFPTETVYGLGADATRSEAVRGIFKAKQRPSDNPLIVHVCSLEQLRGLLRPEPARRKSAQQENGSLDDLETQRATTALQTVGDGRESSRDSDSGSDPIPQIYMPLIERFWPGPLSIILPNSPKSVLAPEVTAGLSTFGARMPNSALALALIKLADVPLAAPSANASTKPSPTTQEHVYHDLQGRIDLILDGGPCTVGVESTVVDGLSDPPTILRPGGVSIEHLRQCKGWENVVVGYRDASEQGAKPKPPGMKYKHYSPRASVVLHEVGSQPPPLETFKRYLGQNGIIGIIRTMDWPLCCGVSASDIQTTSGVNGHEETLTTTDLNLASKLETATGSEFVPIQCRSLSMPVHLISDTTDHTSVTLLDISLGKSIASIAQGLFSALRSLDERGADVIFVEGIHDEGDVAAAVMNRLRKAASETVVGAR